MFVTADMIAKAAGKYGRPERVSFRIPVLAKEFAYIRSSQKHGRCHDTTVYIRKGDAFVVIAKPFYPPGQYRAPSGGLKPGESIGAGIAREMREETGCDVVLSRFLLVSHVTFALSDTPPTFNGNTENLIVSPRGPYVSDNSCHDCEGDEGDSGSTIAWVSYVFLADYAGGDFDFTDRREIREVRLATLSEFGQFAAIMRRSQIGGLHYRAALHEAVARLLR
jgi:8-oxo-dGTP pyrophosphatase MutT (NUDIX family)